MASNVPTMSPTLRWVIELVYSVSGITQFLDLASKLDVYGQSIPDYKYPGKVFISLVFYCDVDIRKSTNTQMIKKW